MAALCCVMVGGSAQAMGTEKTALRDGFAFPKDRTVRIMVFRPDVHVGSQSMGGVNEPRADWTEGARKALEGALDREQKSLHNELVKLPDLTGDDAVLLSDYRGLFQSVASSVVAHKLFPGNRLPTKKERFDWTLGPGVSRLADLGHADYGLFIYTNDSYGSAGRKMFQLFAAAAGVGITSGVHTGYAGLIDLHTGELVWINADLQMGGDVRDAAGADRRIAQLLEGFPGRAAVETASAQAN
jgi:hypothetical protein